MSRAVRAAITASSGVGFTPIAPVISGVPTIDNTAPQVGDVLAASPASTSGAPSPARTWQWYRFDETSELISGATSDTYTVVEADEGQVLLVIQTETNSEGVDTAQSASTSTVVAAEEAPSISGIPTIDNTSPEVGDLLSATPASTDGNPAPTRTWQWFRNDGFLLAISGATSSTYTVVEADDGATLSVRQTETNSEGVAEATSLVTDAVVDPSAPVIDGVPSISGTEQVGETLTAAAATVAGYPPPTRTWQWQRDGANISGANAATYDLVAADEGTAIRVVQTETNSEGLDIATSVATGAIAAASGAWSPTDLSPVSYFRADMGVTESGGDVSLWEDQVGSNDLEQATALDQPTLNATGLGGEACIDFDGVDHWLRNTAFVLGVTDHLTIVWIGRLITTQNGGRFINWGASPRLFEASANLTWSGVGLDPDSQAAHGNADRCHVLQWEESGTQDIFFGSTSQDPLAEGAGGISSTASFAIGAYTNGAVPSNLRIGELIVLDRSLTAGELTSLATYANGRYGTAI